MFAHLRQYPLFALVMMIGALSMTVPALYAAKLGDWVVMRAFLGSMVLILTVSVILGLALMNRTPRIMARAQLLTVVLVYTVLPAFLALPFLGGVTNFHPVQGYFEMLSSLTTTGATLVDSPSMLPPALHLWRGLVAWQGGFFILVIAFSILQPMNIGGFEIRSQAFGDDNGAGTGIHGSGDASERIIRSVVSIAPVYAFATFLLMLLLLIAGERAYVAAIHAMSILSTSGISPVGGMAGNAAGRLGEVFMALFLLFAVSHRMFQSLAGKRSFRWIRQDMEIRISLVVILGVPLLLFLRHWIAAFDEDAQQNILAGLQAFWGGVFTVLSYLTTTGFESADWQTARYWSGLDTPDIVLLGAAVTGGGIATTAGGVKLLRMYALYKHGMRELDHLVHPSSVGGGGLSGRRFHRAGRMIAWNFVMLFGIGIAGVMLALSLNNIDFQDSAGLAIAALTNTGPAAHMLDPSLSFANLDTVSLAILSVAMVFGRVEVLVLVALFNPSYWRL